MRSLTKEAGELAISCHKKGRSSCIVCPDGSYHQAMIDLGTPPPGVFIRFATNEPSMLDIKVDTVITIKSRDMVDRIGSMCKTLVASSKEPMWIDVDNILSIKKGRQIWEQI